MVEVAWGLWLCADSAHHCRKQNAERTATGNAARTGQHWSSRLARCLAGRPIPRNDSDSRAAKAPSQSVRGEGSSDSAAASTKLVRAALSAAVTTARRSLRCWPLRRPQAAPNRQRAAPRWRVGWLPHWRLPLALDAACLSARVAVFNRRRERGLTHMPRPRRLSNPRRSAARESSLLLRFPPYGGFP